MKRLLAWLIMVPAWGGLIYGSLQMHSLDLQLGEHSICGPWGCGPTTEALLGFHSFWLALIVPPAIGFGFALPRRLGGWVGGLILSIGLLGTLAFMSWDMWIYWQQTEVTEHLLQRGLFSVASEVDIPMVQVALAGLCMFGMSQFRSKESAPPAGADVTAVPA